MNNKKETLLLILDKLKESRPLATILIFFVKSDYCTDDKIQIIIDSLIKVFDQRKLEERKASAEKQKNIIKDLKIKSNKNLNKDKIEAEKLLKDLLKVEMLEQEAQNVVNDNKEKDLYGELLVKFNELGNDPHKRGRYAEELNKNMEIKNTIGSLLVEVYKSCLETKLFKSLSPEDKILILGFLNLYGNIESDDSQIQNQPKTTYFVLEESMYDKLQIDRASSKTEIPELNNSSIQDVIGNLGALGVDVRNPNQLKWINLVKDIKTVEDLSKITLNNLSNYIDTSKIDKENISYVLTNFKILFTHYLNLFPSYKTFFIEPGKFLTGARISKMLDRYEFQKNILEKFNKIKNKNNILPDYNVSKEEDFRVMHLFKINKYTNAEKAKKRLQTLPIDSKFIQGLIIICNSSASEYKKSIAKEILQTRAGILLEQMPTKKIGIYTVKDLKADATNNYVNSSFINQYGDPNWIKEINNQIKKCETLNSQGLANFDPDTIKIFLDIFEKETKKLEDRLNSKEETIQYIKNNSASMSVGLAPSAGMIMTTESIYNAHVSEYITNINIKYVELLLKSDPLPSFVIEKRKIKSPLNLLNENQDRELGLTLDFSKTSPSDIVRDDLFEFTRDSGKQIVDDVLSGKYENAFSTIFGMIGGVGGSILTRNPAGFTIGQRFGQGAGGFTGKLLEGESRNDALLAAGVGIGLMDYTYDEVKESPDGVQYLDEDVKSNGATRKWYNNEKKEFSIGSTAKILGDFAFDVGSTVGAGKASKILGLDDLLEPIRNKIVSRYGTSMLGKGVSNSLNLTKRGMDEILVESFLVDMPLNIAQTGLYTLTGIDTKIISGTNTTGTEKNTESKRKSKAWNISDAFAAMGEAYEQNTSMENIGEQIASTLIYGGIMEGMQGSIHKIKEYLPSGAVESFDQSAYRYHELAQQLTRGGLEISEDGNGGFDVKKSDGGALTNEEFDHYEGILKSIKKSFHGLKEISASIVDQHEAMLKDDNSLKGRILNGISRFGLFGLGIPPLMALDKKMANIIAILSQAGLTEDQKTIYGEVLDEMLKLKVDIETNASGGGSGGEDDEGIGLYTQLKLLLEIAQGVASEESSTDGEGGKLDQIVQNNQNAKVEIDEINGIIAPEITLVASSMGIDTNFAEVSKALLITAREKFSPEYFDLQMRGYLQTLDTVYEKLYKTDKVDTNALIKELELFEFLIKPYQDRIKQTISEINSNIELTNGFIDGFPNEKRNEHMLHYLITGNKEGPLWHEYQKSIDSEVVNGCLVFYFESNYDFGLASNSIGKGVYEKSFNDSTIGYHFKTTDYLNSNEKLGKIIFINGKKGSKTKGYLDHELQHYRNNIMGISKGGMPVAEINSNNPEEFFDNALKSKLSITDMYIEELLSYTKQGISTDIIKKYITVKKGPYDKLWKALMYFDKQNEPIFLKEYNKRFDEMKNEINELCNTIDYFSKLGQLNSQFKFGNNEIVDMFSSFSDPNDWTKLKLAYNTIYNIDVDDMDKMPMKLKNYIMGIKNQIFSLKDQFVAVGRLLYNAWEYISINFSDYSELIQRKLNYGFKYNIFTNFQQQEWRSNLVTKTLGADALNNTTIRSIIKEGSTVQLEVLLRVLDNPSLEKIENIYKFLCGDDFNTHLSGIDFLTNFKKLSESHIINLMVLKKILWSKTDYEIIDIFNNYLITDFKASNFENLYNLRISRLYNDNIILDDDLPLGFDVTSIDEIDATGGKEIERNEDASSNKNKYDIHPDIQNENSRTSDELIKNGEIVQEEKAKLEDFLKSVKIKDNNGDDANKTALGAKDKLSDEQVRKIYEVHNMKRNEGETDDFELNKRKAEELRKSRLFGMEQIRVLMEGKVCGMPDISVNESVELFEKSGIGVKLSTDLIEKLKVLNKEDIQSIITNYKLLKDIGIEAKDHFFLLIEKDITLEKIESYKKLISEYPEFTMTFKNPNDPTSMERFFVLVTIAENSRIDKTVRIRHLNHFNSLLTKYNVRGYDLISMVKDDTNLRNFFIIIEFLDNNRDLPKNFNLSNFYQLFKKKPNLNEFLNKDYDYLLTLAAFSATISYENNDFDIEQLKGMDSSYSNSLSNTSYFKGLNQIAGSKNGVVVLHTMKVLKIVRKIEKVFYDDNYSGRFKTLNSLLFSMKEEINSLPTDMRLKIIAELGNIYKKLNIMKRIVEQAEKGQLDASKFLCELRGLDFEKYKKQFPQSTIKLERKGVGFEFYIPNEVEYAVIRSGNFSAPTSDSVGFNVSLSEIPLFNNTISVINGDKGSPDSDETSNHESIHQKNRYLIQDEQSPIKRAKDEITAYLSTGTPLWMIKILLATPEGGYNYIKSFYEGKTDFQDPNDPIIKEYENKRNEHKTYVLTLIKQADEFLKLVQAGGFMTNEEAILTLSITDLENRGTLNEAFANYNQKHVDQMLEKTSTSLSIKINLPSNSDRGVVSKKNEYNFSPEIQEENSSHSDKIINADESIDNQAKNHIVKFMRDNQVLDVNKSLSDIQLRLIYKVHNMHRDEFEIDDTQLNIRKGLALRAEFNHDQIRVLMEGKVCGTEISYVNKSINAYNQKFEEKKNEIEYDFSAIENNFSLTVYDQGSIRSTDSLSNMNFEVFQLTQLSAYTKDEFLMKYANQINEFAPQVKKLFDEAKAIIDEINNLKGEVDKIIESKKIDDREADEKINEHKFIIINKSLELDNKIYDLEEANRELLHAIGQFKGRLSEIKHPSDVLQKMREEVLREVGFFVYTDAKTLQTEAISSKGSVDEKYSVEVSEIKKLSDEDRKVLTHFLLTGYDVDLLKKFDTPFMIGETQISTLREGILQIHNIAQTSSGETDEIKLNKYKKSLLTNLFAHADGARKSSDTTKYNQMSDILMKWGICGLFSNIKNILGSNPELTRPNDGGGTKLEKDKTYELKSYGKATGYESDLFTLRLAGDNSAWIQLAIENNNGVPQLLIKGPTGKFIYLKQGESYYIGRNSELLDLNQKISSNHLEIQFTEEGKILVKDISTNGTERVDSEIKDIEINSKTNQDMNTFNENNFNDFPNRINNLDTGNYEIQFQEGEGYKIKYYYLERKEDGSITISRREDRGADGAGMKVFFSNCEVKVNKEDNRYQILFEGYEMQHYIANGGVDQEKREEVFGTFFNGQNGNITISKI